MLPGGRHVEERVRRCAAVEAARSFAQVLRQISWAICAGSDSSVGEEGCQEPSVGRRPAETRPLGGRGGRTHSNVFPFSLLGRAGLRSLPAPVMFLASLEGGSRRIVGQDKRRRHDGRLPEQKGKRDPHQARGRIRAHPSPPVRQRPSFNGHTSKHDWDEALHGRKESHWRWL